MKVINEDIKKGEFKSVYLLYGEEEYLKKQYKDRLKKAVAGDDTMNYSYFDGEVRFAKVLNKNRRKSLGSYPMDDVIQIAPAGDRSVSQYEREGVKVIDYTSHDKDTAYYDMVLKKEGETLLIKFEPDDKYLEAVEFKYRQKVIRRSTQA